MNSITSRNPARNPITRLFAICAVFFGTLAGCAGGQLSPKAQRAVDTFECYVAVITPHVGDALDAAELVRDTVQGRANLQQALGLLGATVDDIQAINASMRACLPPPPAPLEPEPADLGATESPS